jgi:dTMP kinase
VLADRYIYTAIARAVVRDVSPEYVRGLFGFAVVPDMVFYLQLTVPYLTRRVLMCNRMNYWESGMDLNLGSDLYDCFKKYQSKLIRELDRMAEEYAFLTLDARKAPNRIQAVLREHVAKLLQSRNMTPPLVRPPAVTPPQPPPAVTSAFNNPAMLP